MSFKNGLQILILTSGFPAALFLLYMLLTLILGTGVMSLSPNSTLAVLLLSLVVQGITTTIAIETALETSRDAGRGSTGEGPGVMWLHLPQSTNQDKGTNGFLDKYLPN